MPPPVCAHHNTLIEDIRELITEIKDILKRQMRLQLIVLALVGGSSVGGSYVVDLFELATSTEQSSSDEHPAFVYADEEPSSDGGPTDAL